MISIRVVKAGNGAEHTHEVEEEEHAPGREVIRDEIERQMLLKQAVHELRSF